MKKRVALIASGVTSPLYSQLEFANRLRAAGYCVQIYAPLASHELIKFADFEHVVIPDPIVGVFTPLLPRPGQQRFKRNSRKQRLKEAVPKLGVDDLGEALLSFSPDLIIVDCELHAHIVLALSLGPPVIQSNNMFLSPPGLRAPPLHKKSVPGQGFRGSKLGVCLIWAGYIAQKNIKIVRRMWRDWGGDLPSAVNELARQKGIRFSRLRRIISWQMPWTYRIPTILFLPQALDLPTNLYPDMQFVGPMILQKRLEQQGDDAKFARFREASPDKKYLYAAFGTRISPSDQFVKRLLRVFSQNTQWQALLVVGSHWVENVDYQIPSNVDVVSWAPQLEMLEHADLAIMHGGTGGLIEAVETCTPVLVYPHDIDQFGSAARAVFHGIGRIGDLTDSKEQIEGDIFKLLENESVSLACKKMQLACRSERDSKLAEKVVRQMIEK